MARRQFKVPFAATGDVVSVPDAVQPDGSVSLQQGYGFDYQRDPDTDPLAKVFPRDVHNGILNEITASIGEIQQQGYPIWVAEGAPYPVNAVVRHSGANWRSTAGNNNTVPGTAGADWDRADILPATEVLRGVLRIGTQAEVDAGALDDVAVTPKKMRAGFAISLLPNGYIAFPTWLGGLIVQWGAATADGSGIATVVLPVSFPNAIFALLTNTRANNFSTYSVNRASSSLSGFTAKTTSSNVGVAGQSFDWFAVGY